jgi:hypothetical protein
MNKFNTQSSDITVDYIGEDDNQPCATLKYNNRYYGFWDIENPSIIKALDDTSHKQHSQVANYLKHYLNKFINGERDEEGADTLYVPKFGQLSKLTPM